MTSEQKMPMISVVIPFRNSEKTISQCLDSVSRQRYRPYEVILMDDSSTDESKAISVSKGFDPIACSNPFPFCRNDGARRAKGKIIFFTDSDVVLPLDTLERVAKALEDSRWDAVVGTYSARHPNENLSSQYKNLWIRYSYLERGESIDFIFGAVSAIRRQAFFDLGGFDGRFSHKTGGVDTDMGLRLKEKGYAIRLDPSIEVIHLKRYSFFQLLTNDFCRSLGYSRLGTRRSLVVASLRKGFSNIYSGFIWSVALAWLCLFAGTATFAVSPLLGLVVAVLLCVYFLTNRRFLLFYARNRSWGEALRIAPILFVDHLVCGLGSAVGLVWGFLRGR